MLSELELPEEGFPTQIAPVGLLSCMEILVIGEPRLLDERFPALTAHVRFLDFLSFLMLVEWGLSADEVLTFGEFHLRAKLFTVSMETGCPISS